MNIVAFPGLGLNFTINPVAFNIAGKDIYWYGIIIAVGFLLAIIYTQWDSKRLDISPDIISDIVLWATLPAIIGARLYYVIFRWSYYSEHKNEIFAVWEGGIAIYGAIITALLVALIYFRVKKINMWPILDIGAMGLLIGQSIGRWGNFVNAEAYGEQTNLPWRMQLFSNELNKMITVHPTFLYESLWNAIGFFVLFLTRRKKPFNGFVFWCYLTWYGLGRFWVEALRSDSLYLGSLKISQLVAAVCVIAGLSAIWLGMRRVKSKE